MEVKLGVYQSDARSEKSWGKCYQNIFIRISKIIKIFKERENRLLDLAGLECSVKSEQVSNMIKLHLHNIFIYLFEKIKMPILMKNLFFSF